MSINTRGRHDLWKLSRSPDDSIFDGGRLMCCVDQREWALAPGSRTGQRTPSALGQRPGGSAGTWGRSCRGKVCRGEAGARTGLDASLKGNATAQVRRCIFVGEPAGSRCNFSHDSQLWLSCSMQYARVLRFDILGDMGSGRADSSRA